MTENPLDSILTTILDSVNSTNNAVDSLINSSIKDEQPELIKTLVDGIETGTSNPLDPVSLLSLKNSSLLGYITDLSLLLSIRLKKLHSDESLKVEEESVLKSTVVNRVILERGVKSLEKKLGYQLDKLINAYQRREKEQNDVEENASRKKYDDNGNEVEENEEKEDDLEEDSEDEESALNFKPNPSALLTKPTSSSRTGKSTGGKSETSKHTESNDKYKPPKIAAMALSTATDPDKDSKSGRKQRNLQSMDEYLQDISETPLLENSIGSTIINKGRDMKSKKQIEKEEEVKRYEEENFTRLPTTRTKESKTDRSKRMRNEFFGEDWSMFDNNRDIADSKSSGIKKRKRVSAWERAKKKIDN